MLLPIHIPNSFGEILFEKPQNLQRVDMNSLTFYHSSNSQFLIAAISLACPRLSDSGEDAKV